MLKSLVILLRPQQWLKNLFVLAPAFFAGSFLVADVLRDSLLTFIIFSAAASTVYIFNDWIDRQADSKHPEKRTRPIASGQISGKIALITGLLTLLMSMLMGLSFLNFEVIAITGSYLVLNLAYTLILKNIAILDVSCIAIGFVLRLFAGSEATGIELSSWIITLTFLLALFLALAKRRDDVIREQRGEERTRTSIKGYNLRFLDQTMTVMGAVVIVAYLQYCHAADRTIQITTSRLYLSAAFVVIGLLRYMQLALVEERSGNPTRILIEDRFTQINLLVWGGFFAWMLYR
ncbi:MAG: decaprenyl-phosphate phosphoribosyltransferase [Deltaproteobacteria bacterium]